MKVVCRAADGRSGYAARTARGRRRDRRRRRSPRRADKVTRRGRAARVDRSARASYPVVLDPDAVGRLLELLGVLAFNGLAHAEGRGALSGRLGKRVAAPAITSPTRPASRGTLPRAFDSEGVPKGRSR